MPLYSLHKHLSMASTVLTGSDPFLSLIFKSFSNYFLINLSNLLSNIPYRNYVECGGRSLIPVWQKGRTRNSRPRQDCVMSVRSLHETLSHHPSAEPSAKPQSPSLFSFYLISKPHPPLCTNVPTHVYLFV